ncbi:hypothetical protein CJ010_11005 [Azoarcus sp. DD4]|uniref:TlpA family protein disulfide reductase n=1 Tax=Azoarcus sp. DD4 TaxID=2027405 RepID=UPI0011262467|nr:hypothetical protein [Azoarcus sp. DD4]QDF97017.1 hypothetical protein CJ010_11005 [Azoarcus sp. DD4]
MKVLTLLFVFCLAGAAVAGEPFHALDRGQAAVLADPAAHAVPTVVALWSADCAYCKKNLAVFAALARAHPGLRLVTVATEPVAEAEAEPLDRLAVPGPRYAYGMEAPEALAHALDGRWRGELPRTLLFDGRGGCVAVSGVIGEAEARQALGF